MKAYREVKINQMEGLKDQLEDIKKEANKIQVLSRCCNTPELEEDELETELDTLV